MLTWSGFGLVLALLGSAPAQDGAQLQLEWAADPACDDPATLRQELSRYRLTHGDDPGTARVEIRAGEGGVWSVDLHLELVDGAIDRRFEAASCDLAISATALMIAVALDPAGALEELESEPGPAPAPTSEPQPTSETQPQSEPQSESESQPQPAPRRDLGLVATLAGQGGLGPLPGFGGEMSASFGLRARAARVDLAANLGFPRIVPIEGHPDTGVRLYYWSLGLRGCGEPVIARARVVFLLCVGAELGPLTARGFGLDENRRSSARWMATTGTAGVSWLPTRIFGVFLGFEGWLGIARPRTHIEGLGLIHRPAQAGARVRAGVEFRWPSDLRLGRANNPRRRRPSRSQ